MISEYHGDIRLSIDNILKQLHPIFVMEGREPRNHLIDKAAKTPPINLDTVPKLANNLRGQVFRSSADGLGLFVLPLQYFGQPKVSQFYIAGAIDYNVLRF